MSFLPFCFAVHFVYKNTYDKNKIEVPGSGILYVWYIDSIAAKYFLKNHDKYIFFPRHHSIASEIHFSMHFICFRMSNLLIL